MAGWFAPNDSLGTENESEPVSHRLERGKPRSARPAKRVCASSVSPVFGGPTETKKALHRRCFKPPIQNPGDHRHVRIWASADVWASPWECKGKFDTPITVPKIALEGASRKKEGAALGRPSDRPPIGTSRFWSIPARQRPRVGQVVPHLIRRVPVIGMSSKHFDRLCPPGNTLISLPNREPRTLPDGRPAAA